MSKNGLKRYDAQTDEFVELTQDYFDRLQHQFTRMLFHYNNHCPDQYKDFTTNYKYEN